MEDLTDKTHVRCDVDVLYDAAFEFIKKVYCYVTCIAYKMLWCYLLCV